MPGRMVYKWFWDRVNKTKKRATKKLRKYDKSTNLKPSMVAMAMSKFN